MNALDFLHYLHRKLKKLFEHAEDVEGFEEKKRLFLKIKRELLAHARIEEGIVYPMIENNDELKPFVNESYTKHKHVEVLLRGIGELVSERKPCDPELEILKETVCRGNEDEEKQIFPHLREVLGNQGLEQIGEQIAVATGGVQDQRHHDQNHDVKTRAGT
jgi:hemerythrin superfamily protein